MDLEEDDRDDGFSGEEATLRSISSICTRIYEPGDNNKRIEAENQWNNFMRKRDFFRLAMQLMKSDNMHAQVVTATSLSRLVANVNCQLSIDERVEVKAVVIQVLQSNFSLPKFVTQAYIQLYVSIIKFGWLDLKPGPPNQPYDFVFRNFVTDVESFFLPEKSRQQQLVGLQIYHQLVNTITQSESARTLTRHRKTSISFRDNHLFNILVCATENLNSLNKAECVSDSDFDFALINLHIIHACLSFDFLGLYSDESSEDLTVVQVPMTWRSHFVDTQCLNLYFQLFTKVSQTMLASAIIYCITLYVSIRRSLFSSQERMRYLQVLFMGLREMLRRPAHFLDNDCYHEFCRLFAHIKSNYQLTEMIRCECYLEVMKMIAEFTVQSLEVVSFSSNSAHYLLSFWHRLVACLPYMKQDDEHGLEMWAPQVTQAFMKSRINSPETNGDQSIEDPLEDLGEVEVQLEMISTIARCDYIKNCTELHHIFTTLLREFEGCFHSLNVVNSYTRNAKLVLAKLTWCVYFVGCFLSGRQPYTVSDTEDDCDGTLVGLAVQLAHVTENLMENGNTNERFELALLYFFDQFRRVCVADQISRHSKLFTQLTQLGLDSEMKLFKLLMEKVVRNLRFGANSEKILNDSLSLLDELSIGYTAAKKLIKLESSKFLLFNHDPEHFHFLKVNRTPKQMKCRKKFYEELKIQIQALSIDKVTAPSHWNLQFISAFSI